MTNTFTSHGDAEFRLQSIVGDFFALRCRRRSEKADKGTLRKLPKVPGAFDVELTVNRHILESAERWKETQSA